MTFTVLRTSGAAIYRVGENGVEGISFKFGGSWVVVDYGAARVWIPWERILEMTEVEDG